jgi:hypothetical protein
MNMMKALIPSTILTLIVSALVGRTGLQGGFLNLQDAVIGGYALYWSWTLFFVAMALNGGIVLQMARREGPAATEKSVGSGAADKA